MTAVDEPAGRIVTLDVVDGTPEADAQRIKARAAAGLRGIVIVVVRPHDEL